jgi:hypothetical protein
MFTFNFNVKILSFCLRKIQLKSGTSTFQPNFVFLGGESYLAYIGDKTFNVSGKLVERKEDGQTVHELVCFVNGNATTQRVLVKPDRVSKPCVELKVFVLC